MKAMFCPYCGRPAEYADSKIVYGRSFGMVYICRPCDAYVGVHRGTNKPLGRLANMELRRLKREAHAAFDPIWQQGRFRGNRKAAYQWLSQQMGLPGEKTHIGLFDVPECKHVIQICKKGSM